MSNIRDLGRKISSLQNMQKVTRAMNMISSIKLRKLYALQGALEFFHTKTDEMKEDIIRCINGVSHPAIEGYSRVTKVHLVIFTADKGLCGTHNSSVIKEAEKFLSGQEEKGIQVEISSIGNKGTGFCRRKELDLYKSSEIAEKSFDTKALRLLSDEIYQRFMQEEVQEVYILGNIFYSALQQETELKQVLPLLSTVEKALPDEGCDMAIEPSGDSLAEKASSLFLKYKLESYLLNSLLSEHSARMTAMENATNNSKDLINKYMTIQNHARQAAITNELIEIVSGKEALKG